MRAIGPSLAKQWRPQPLCKIPFLRFHEAIGELISTNDNWRSTQQAEIIADLLAPTTIANRPSSPHCSRVTTRPFVRGQDSTTGVALVEVYNLDAASPSQK